MLCRIFAPTERHRIAQGNALGNRFNKSVRLALKGRDKDSVAPLQGSRSSTTHETQGVALGCRIVLFQSTEPPTAADVDIFPQPES